MTSDDPHNGCKGDYNYVDRPITGELISGSFWLNNEEARGGLPYERGRDVRRLT